MSNTKNIDNWLDTPYLFDKVGRLIITDSEVYRVIVAPKSIDTYRELLGDQRFDDIVETGLIDTKIHIYDESKSILVLEHKKLDFILSPSEYTNHMFWEATMMFVKMSEKLFKEFGLLTKDAHPWNITYSGAQPVFYDFSSLYMGREVTNQWFAEFKRYFGFPIALASKSDSTYPLARLYRKEHLEGFGITTLENNLFEKKLLKKLTSLSKYQNQPQLFFNKLLQWLDKNKPISPTKEYWSDYEQSHLADFDNPQTIKQKFVYDSLKESQPQKVLDLASNKGFYAAMAEHLGASVIAFDYEEETINQCRLIAKNNNLKITPALVNFSLPTPPSGVGLGNDSSFVRFHSEVVLALGLIHHICLTQKIPVSLFCDICMNYTADTLILEFVYPDDVHVQKWKAEIPDDYDLDKISNYLSVKFPVVTKSELIARDGVHRVIVSYSKGVV